MVTGMSGTGTVFKACDVLSAVAQRNGEAWKENTVMHILEQVCFFLNECLVSSTKLIRILATVKRFKC